MVVSQNRDPKIEPQMLQSLLWGTPKNVPIILENFIFVMGVIFAWGGD